MALLIAGTAAAAQGRVILNLGNGGAITGDANKNMIGYKGEF